ncbi:MAG: ABC transporter permease subunit [Armatimonadota bacterium]|nr:ABC transporter permease subunit [Armatimonadota bacterium]MDR5696688.1 ABC transporter permease subunit [Armatimonadota bacterium]
MRTPSAARPRQRGLHAARTVAAKEVTDVVRDRRALILGVVLPALVVPAISLVLPILTARRAAEPAAVAVVGAERAPELIETARSAGLVRVVPVADPDLALQQGQVAAILEIPTDFARRLRAGQAYVVLRYNAAEQAGEEARAKVLQAVARHSVDIIDQRLRERGLDRRLLTPIEVREELVAAQQRGNLFVAILLPLIVALWAFGGGLHVAADLGAGEKERGTLEGLLVAPVDRWALAAGKVAAATAMAWVSVAVAATSQYLVLAFGPASVADLFGRPSLTAPLLAVLAGVGGLLAVAFAAVLLCVSLFARSMREANQYAMPLMLLVMLSAFATPALEDWARTTAAAYAVPVVNAVLVLRAALAGRYDLGALALTSASLAACAALGVAVAAWLVSRESVVLRS